MRIIFIILLVGIVLLSILGCSRSLTTFNVAYYGKYTSSAGDRILNITYMVTDGAIVSCTGTYSYPAPQERYGQTDTEPCNVTRLNNHEYNVPLELITTMPSGAPREGSSQYGPRRYSWSIVS